VAITLKSSPRVEFSGGQSRWYPTQQQLSDPSSVERSVRQILHQQYALTDRVGALEAPSEAAEPVWPPPGSGPTDSMLVGLHVFPIDTGTLADGNVLTYVKKAQNLQFLPGGGGGGGVTSFNGRTGVVVPTSGDYSVSMLSGLPVTVSEGGTSLVTLTAHAVLLGEGTSAVAFASPGTAGQVLTSNGASSDPTFQAVTASVGTPVENEVVSFSGTSGTLAHTPSAISGYTQVKLYRNGVRQTPTADFSWVGTAVTLVVAALGSDTFIADYYQ